MTASVRCRSQNFNRGSHKDMRLSTWGEWNTIWKDGDLNLECLPFCIDCADFTEGEIMNHGFASRCFNCGKNMRHRLPHNITDANINCFCSLRCKEVVLSRRRQQKERRKRRAEGVICASCLRRFVPGRGDAITCSSRCRQRMYRLRALQINRQSQSGSTGYP